MRSMFRFLGALFVGATLMAAAGPSSAQEAPGGSTLDNIVQKGELRVGWATYYPHLYLDPKTNEVTGISADILKVLAERLGVKLVMVEDSWATLIAGLQADKFDMTVPAFGISLPRAIAVTYTDPVFQTPIGLMVRKEDVEKYPDAKAMDKAGIRITTTLGSSTDMFLSNSFREAEILRVRSDADSITQLMTNRAEGWGSTIDAFEDVSKEHENLVPLPNGLIGFTKLAIGVRRGEYHWRDYLNYFIAEIQDQGLLAKIFEEHGLPPSYLLEKDQ